MSPWKQWPEVAVEASTLLTQSDIPTVFGVPVTSIGAGGLVIIVVLLILTGRLVPRSVLNDKDKEADRWRQAYLNLEKAIKEQGDQIDKLAGGQKLILDVVEAFRRAVE